MGKPLMIQEKDDEQIEDLKMRTGLKTKIDVVRSALRLLEAEVERRARILRWQKAVKMVGNSGLQIAKEFKRAGRFKKIP